MISEAAKQVQVETHVLRYWEEELQLPIKRNDMGHRYYTMEDVMRFKEIKNLKEQGLQLKAIRTVLLKEGQGEKKEQENGTANMAVDKLNEDAAMELLIGKKQKYIVSLSEEESRAEKASRLQYLLQHMIMDSVRNANKELCTEIKESILKELDYQFRAREEKEEEHWKKQEEHFRKVDEMLRERYQLKEKMPKKEKRKLKFIKR